MTASDEEFAQRAYPGNDIPVVALQQSHSDWTRYGGRGDEGTAQWTPLGPTYAKGLPNPYRDRSVYTAGTANFSGRDAFVAIDPNCGSKGHGDDYRKSAKDDGRGNDNHNNGNDESSCRLWLANANGGIWRTDNALSKNPQWKYLSRVFQHNNTASIQLDPNDKSGNTLWVGTGEPNACGSGCEAGVGLYRSTDGGDHWAGPYGQDAFYDRAVGSIAIEPGNSNIMYAASGRAIRGLTSTCCGGADALIPGAPHFGVYRSTDGGQHWELVNQGASALCNTVSPDVVSTNGTPCSPRGARRVLVDPVDPHTVRSFFARGIWRSNHDGAAGSWEQIRCPSTRSPYPAPESGRPSAPSSTWWRTRRRTRRACTSASAAAPCTRGSARTSPCVAPAAAVAASWIDKSSGLRPTRRPGRAAVTATRSARTTTTSTSRQRISRSRARRSTPSISPAPIATRRTTGAGFQRPLLPGQPGDRPLRQPRGDRLDGRRHVLHRHDGGSHLRSDLPVRAPSGPARARRQPDELEAVLRGRRRRHHALERQLREQLGRLRRPEREGLDRRAAGLLQAVLSRVPETLTAINAGLRTLHFYELNYSPFDPNLIVAGAQDNGSWEIGDTQGFGVETANPLPNTVGEPSTKCRTDAGRGNDGDSGNDHNTTSQNQVWVQINIADGGQNNFDIGDPCFRQSAWQSGQLMVAYTPKNQLDMNWIADTLLGPYGNEATASGVTPGSSTTRCARTGCSPVVSTCSAPRIRVGTRCSRRRSTGRSATSGTARSARRDSAGEPIQCDDWQPLGDPGAAGRLTSTTYGPDKIETRCRLRHLDGAFQEGLGDAVGRDGRRPRLRLEERGRHERDGSNVDRIDNDPTAGPTPNRFVSAISIDPNDPNHAIVVFQRLQREDAGHAGARLRRGTRTGCFDVEAARRQPAVGRPGRHPGDIPSALTTKGTIYIGTDYGVVSSFGDGVWRRAGDGLPGSRRGNLMYVPEKQKLYVATHGQGVWELLVDGIEAKDHHGHGGDGHGNGH